ncbi:hypothetical protein [Actinokineospora enzanensis]|uniref:hypothetical protein n=1 Tax=Actinokineospora enzanensis TaxID=155975 RepID=UPI000381D8C3|nr:hypothetical protein [Actinokineospora enzanensis]
MRRILFSFLALSALLVTGAPVAQAAVTDTYTIVRQASDPTHPGRKVYLWRNNSTYIYHGQVVGALSGTVYLKGPGCPGGGTCQYRTLNVGATSGNTGDLGSGAVDVCADQNGGPTLCTCLACLAPADSTAAVTDRQALLGRTEHE